MMKPILLYTSFSNIQEARHIAEQLVSEKLAACVNLFDGMQSYYQWEGKLEQATEVAALIKTTSQMEAPLMERLAELHPYDTPCMLTIPIENGYMPYLSWLQNSCQPTNH